MPQISEMRWRRGEICAARFHGRHSSSYSCLYFVLETERKTLTIEDEKTSTKDEYDRGSAVPVGNAVRVEIESYE